MYLQELSCEMIGLQQTLLLLSAWLEYLNPLSARMFLSPAINAAKRAQSKTEPKIQHLQFSSYYKLDHR